MASRRREEEGIDTREQAGDEEDRAAGLGEDQRLSFRQRAARADDVVAPVLLFVSCYVVTAFVLVLSGFAFVYWMGLTSVTVATIATVLIWDRRQWPLGLFVSPRLAVPEFLFGSLWGVLLIGACALLVVLSTDVRHEPGSGFPFAELLLVFIPAVLHEELLFRGYAFQRLHRRNRWVALIGVAVLFAALHAGNTAVSVIGLLNVFLGGVLLGLAYERYRRLWFPIGLHLAWNITSGPVLGHEVSGYVSMATLFVERGHGAPLLTGGDFGIEGSVWMTLTESAGILLLLHMIRKRSQPS